ncbi:hypothetical protein GGI24_004567, partial [Coemansia furcata]
MTITKEPADSLKAPTAPNLIISVDERIRNKSSHGAIYANARYSFNMLSEMRMRRLSGAIRAKADWFTKLQNAEIRDCWKTEAKSQSVETCERWKADPNSHIADIYERCNMLAEDHILTDLEIDYVFAELDYYASLHKPGTNIMLGAVDSVWCSDSLVDDETTKALKDYAAILEN